MGAPEPALASPRISFADWIEREPVVPWSPGGKIPWHEPAFSARMLREHLSQQHDRASRRFETIDRHVCWLQENICAGAATRILDLGCGPGFYTARLARLGHDCVGIDFSPASIAHARTEAERDALRCEYRLQDLREADPGTGFDVALLTFGELNAFSPADVRSILHRARRALARRGTLILEVHSEAFVRSIGEGCPIWYTSRQSVFSDAPHLCLRECSWHPQHRAATERYFVVSLPATDGATYVSTLQAYSEDEYASLLREAGFDRIRQHASLAGERAEPQDGLFVLEARANDTP